jgi:hypothetical protein
VRMMVGGYRVRNEFTIERDAPEAGHREWH